MKPYLICYDIEQDRKRKKIADKLIEYGLERIQYSVFAGCLKEHLLQKLQIWLEEKIASSENEPKKEKDSVIILPITVEIIKKIIIFGTSEVNVEELAGTQRTLFF